MIISYDFLLIKHLFAKQNSILQLEIIIIFLSVTSYFFIYLVILVLEIFIRS